MAERVSSSSDKAWQESLDAETKRMRLLTAGFAGGLANMMLMIGAVVSGRGPDKPPSGIIFFLFIGALLFLRGFLRSVEFNRLSLIRSRAAFQAAVHKEEMDRLIESIRQTNNEQKKQKLAAPREAAQTKYQEWSAQRDSYDEPRERIYTWMEKNLRIAVLYAGLLIMLMLMLTEPGRAIVDKTFTWVQLLTSVREVPPDAPPIEPTVSGGQQDEPE